MKARFTMFASLLIISLTAGCHAQQITPNPVTTAPAVTSTAFSQLNISSPTAALTYTDQPVTGSFCYFVQTLDGGSGVSSASNTVCATTTSTLKHVQLNWNVPTGYTCQTACTYVVSRAAAIITPVGSPSMTSPTNIALGVKPLRPPVNEAFHLSLATGE